MRLSNIILNLISSVFTNPITMIFILIISIYSIIKILENKKLYDFINMDLIELNENYKRSRLYVNAINKYEYYRQDNTYADINISSFIEELASGFANKNKYIVEEIRNIKNSSSTCILLGVLGTFVGLSMMLLTLDTRDIINSLPATINSMQTAFITSIFGIVCSILINISLRVKDSEHILIQLMLKLENLLTSEVTHSKSEHVNSKIEEVKNTIKQISKSIEAIERFDKISKDLNDFNDEFISSIEALKCLLEGSENSIKTFDQSVRKIDKQFSILNIKFTKLFDKYDNLDDINKEILLDIKESSKAIYEAADTQYKVRDYIKNINAGFALYERSAQDLLTKLISHENKVLKTQSELNQEKVNLDNTVKNLSSIITISSNDIQEKLDIMFNYLDIYKEASNLSSDEFLEKYAYTPIYDDEEIYEIENDYDLGDYPRHTLTYPIIKNRDEDDLDD